MKRALMLAALVALVLGTSGCFLGDLFHTDIRYEADYVGAGGMDISYVDEDGELRTQQNVSFPWTKTVSMENGKDIIAYVRVQANFGTTSVTATVRAEGVVMDSDTDATDAWASYLVE